MQKDISENKINIKGEEEDKKQKDKNELSFKCNSGCCNLYINKSFKEVWISEEEWFKTHKRPTLNKIKKAGTFIFDPKSEKILIVQSRGKFWGSPKGSIDDDESIKHCAVRETMEETGIIIQENILNKFSCIKGKCIYYDLEVSEFNPSIQTGIKDNDASGIGWIKINCLKNLIDKGYIIINQHLRLLIKKKFNIDLLYKY